MILAVCGKGGVGKTSVSALITKILMRRTGKKILAIDADPAVGLATALGMTPRRTIDDIRKEIIHAVRTRDKKETAYRIEYEVMDALVEKENLAFMAVGRPEEAGCFCRVNSLLKEIISSMTRHFDYVIIDGEAGVEQINRRVMTNVTHLLLVSDTSLKGRQVAETIRKLAKSVVGYEKAGVIINRIRNEAELLKIPEPRDFIGCLMESEELRSLDMDGKSLSGFRDEAFLKDLSDCLERMGFYP